MMPKSLAPKYVHIDNPQSYHCTVWRYQADHQQADPQQMLVRVHRSEESGAETAFYLYFGGVMYFEGPLHWHGAEFLRGPEEECIAILHKIGFKYAEDAVRSDYYCLFKVKLPQLEVRIVAQAAVKLDESEITVADCFARSRQSQ